MALWLLHLSVYIVWYIPEPPGSIVAIITVLSKSIVIGKEKKSKQIFLRLRIEPTTLACKANTTLRGLSLYILNLFTQTTGVRVRLGCKTLQYSLSTVAPRPGFTFKPHVREYRGNNNGIIKINCNRKGKKIQTNFPQAEDRSVFLSPILHLTTLACKANTTTSP